MTHSTFEASIPAVMRQFGLSAERAAPVVGGTLNWNYRVETRQGTFFLRRYRDDLETERIAVEHTLVVWVAERGIPAPCPLAATNGARLVHEDGGRWTLFPWMPGAPVTRGTLNLAQVRAAGEMQGRIQRVLAEHPASDGARMQMRWDKLESLAALAMVIDVAKKQGAERWIIEGMELQREMLTKLEVRPPETFAALPCQVLHGDYHDQQLLFEGDAVTAVVDWEIWHSDPRAWEVVRSLAFSRLLESPLVGDYAAGYREHVQLDAAECEMALDLWWQSRVAGLWAWAAHFLRGNERVKDFFPEMVAELQRVRDPQWTAAVRERVVAAFAR